MEGVVFEDIATHPGGAGVKHCLRIVVHREQDGFGLEARRDRAAGDFDAADPWHMEVEYRHTRHKGLDEFPGLEAVCGLGQDPKVGLGID
jgi:hypothetical protein